MTKVHEFTFTDKFKWSLKQIREEAINAAKREGDFIGYEFHSLKMIKREVDLYKDATVYHFEVYGRWYEPSTSDQRAQIALEQHPSAKDAEAWFKHAFKLGEESFKNEVIIALECPLPDGTGAEYQGAKDMLEQIKRDIKEIK